MKPAIRPKAILTGNVKQTLAELNLRQVWLHRAVFRGKDEDGPVCIFSVNNPTLLNRVELRDYTVHHSAELHPKLSECEQIAKQPIRR